MLVVAGIFLSGGVTVVVPMSRMPAPLNDPPETDLAVVGGPVGKVVWGEREEVDTYSFEEAFVMSISYFTLYCVFLFVTSYLYTFPYRILRVLTGSVTALAFVVNDSIVDSRENVKTQERKNICLGQPRQIQRCTVGWPLARDGAVS